MTTLNVEFSRACKKANLDRKKVEQFFKERFIRSVDDPEEIEDIKCQMDKKERKPLPPPPEPPFPQEPNPIEKNDSEPEGDEENIITTIDEYNKDK